MISLTLNTKFCTPEVPHHFTGREFLLEKLNSGLEKKITILSASAGFGKTTLLSKWANSLPANVAWVSLDEKDNNPIIFLSMIINSLSKQKDDFGTFSIPLLNASSETTFLISSLINEIEEKLEKTVLILDDFHFINNTLIYDYINYFIKNLPEKIHLVISSRTEPNISLSKLRLNDEVNEIRTNELRFTLHEQKEFFKKYLGFEFKEDQIEKINNRTEGWIAGLRFSIQAMRGKNYSDFVNSLYEYNGFVEEYLLDEVFENSTPEIRDFLLKTSFLLNFSTDLCNSILEIDNSKDLISKIKTDNLFIQPVENKSEWFRYHNLFREILNKRLKTEKKFDLRELYDKAFNWFEQKEMFLDAMHYAVEIKDFEKYGFLLSQICIEKIMKGEFLFFKSMAEKLPESLLPKYPMTSVCLGWANCLSNNLDNVDKYIKYAEKYTNQESSVLNAIVIHIELLRAYFYTLYVNADSSYFRNCIGLLTKVKTEIREDNLKGIVERILAGMYIVTNEWEKALENFQSAKNTSKINNNYLVWSSSVSNYAMLLLFNGKITKAKDICLETINEIQTVFNSEFVPVLAYIHQPLAKAYHELNRNEEAISILSDSVGYAEKIGNKFLTITSRLDLSLIHANEKRLNKSLENLNQAEDLLEYTSIYRDVFIEFNLLRLWIIHKKYHQVEEFINNYLSKRSKQVDTGDYREIITAMYLTEQKKYNEAEKILELIIDSEKNKTFKIYWMETLLLYVFTLNKQQKVSKAAEYFHYAIEYGMERNYKKTLMLYYEKLSDLFDNEIKKQENNSTQKYLIDIIKNVRNFKDKTLSDPLSEREIEILKFLNVGFTNQEISEKLFLAIGTVKKHTNSIYTKLNVNNRISAIQKAKELDLF